jgi:hypothetical protein
MGRAVPRGGSRRASGSQLTATPAAPPDTSGGCSKDRAAARQRWTGKQIAAEAGVSPATVSRVLRRLGLNKLSALELEPVRRYERENPGELIHIDIKKLGRIGGVGHRSRDDERVWSTATSVSVGSSSMFVSTMHLASPSAG